MQNLNSTSQKRSLYTIKPSSIYSQDKAQNIVEASSPLNYQKTFGARLKPIEPN